MKQGAQDVSVLRRCAGWNSEWSRGSLFAAVLAVKVSARSKVILAWLATEQARQGLTHPAWQVLASWAGASARPYQGCGALECLLPLIRTAAVG